jgi:hypothetical protein
MTYTHFCILDSKKVPRSLQPKSHFATHAIVARTAPRLRLTPPPPGLPPNISVARRSCLIFGAQWKPNLTEVASFLERNGSQTYSRSPFGALVGEVWIMYNVILRPIF